MKVFLILSTLVVASFAYPEVKTWTLNELSTAIETKSHPELQPSLEEALNTIMFALYSGNEKNIFGVVPSPTGEKTWTIDQLRNAIATNTKPNFQPFIRSALQQLINLQADGSSQNSVAVEVPAMDISTWKITDVQDAKEDPATKSELQPHLDQAIKEIEEALKQGEEPDSISVTLVTHIGLVTVQSGTVPELIPRSSQ